jgi:hypothetical protein
LWSHEALDKVVRVAGAEPCRPLRLGPEGSPGSAAEFERVAATLETSRRTDADNLAHEQAKIERPHHEQHRLENAVVQI